MEIRYIDIHSHLNFPQFDEDREVLIAKLEEEGIATITIGTGLKTSVEAVELAQKYDHLCATIGIHPTDADEAFDEAAFESLLGPKIVAVGECGLDYFRGMRDGGQEDATYKDKQRTLFIKQIEFAQKHGLPLMLHCRASKGTQDAYEEALDILAAYPHVKGNFHFFAGNLATARRAIDADFSLSFDGPVTFTEEYDEVIRFVPEDMIHAETDAPFAAPVPYRGKRNEPAYVTHVVARLAAVRGVPEEALREQLITNAKKAFPRMQAFF